MWSVVGAFERVLFVVNVMLGKSFGEGDDKIMPWFCLLKTKSIGLGLGLLGLFRILRKIAQNQFGPNMMGENY